MKIARLSLPVGDWPEIDRERWRLALASAGFLEADKPASHWSPARRRIGEQAYGQWLASIDRKNLLDSACMPSERASKDRLLAFAAELQNRVSPASVAMMVGALLRMLAVLEPEHDWRWLAQVYNHLKQTARPLRDKLASMVAASDLLDLGIRLMSTHDEGARPHHRAIRYRDGLLIAFLISCPVRIKNLAGIVIGRHLLFDGRDYRLELAAAETKTGRPYHAAVPAELTRYIDRWLEIHRPILVARQLTQSIARDLAARPEPVEGGVGNHLWVGRGGRPMGSAAIRLQIKLRTQYAFGKAVWPHLFRDCAVTELVDSAPDEIGIAPDLLGHTSLQTTSKHYIKAQGMTAHARVQELIATRRRAATSRATTAKEHGDA